MPWNMKDFPTSMKDSDKLARKKAIDIISVLLDERYPDNRTTPITIGQAKKWYEDANRSEKRTLGKEESPSQTDEHDTNPCAGRLSGPDVTVEYGEEQWTVRSKRAKKTSNRFDTEKETIGKEKQAAQNKESTLFIYKKDGTKEKEVDYWIYVKGS